MQKTAHRKICLTIFTVCVVLAVTNTSNSAIAQSPTPIETSCVSNQDIYVSFMEFSPDSTMIMTKISRNELNLWDIRSGKLLHTFVFDDDIYLASMPFSPDSRYVAVGGYFHKTVILLDVISGNKIRTFSNELPVDEKTYIGKTEMIFLDVFPFTPDGKYILAYDRFGLYLWETETGRLVLRYFDLAPTISWRDATLSPDGTYILADKVIEKEAEYYAQGMLWDRETGKLLHIFDRIDYATFSPDGKYIFTRGFEHSTVWDAKTFAKVREFDWTTGGLLSEDYLIYRHEQDYITILDIRSGDQLLKIKLGPDRGVFMLSKTLLMLPSSYMRQGDSQLGNISYDIWDITARKVVRNLVIEDIQHFITPDRRYLVTVSDKGVIKRLDVQTGKMINCFVLNPKQP